MDPAKQCACLERVPGNVAFAEKVQKPLFAADIEILQLNVGRRCNLACKHCHVEAGPSRTEIMGRPVFEKALEIISRRAIETIDLTGGAPEMNPHLQWFIEAAAKLKRRLMVRSNLAILLDPAYRHFIDVYTDNQVEIVTSLADYQARGTDRQRGQGVYASIIEVMRVLNRKGYGVPQSNLILNLAHNPVGAFLPGCQAALAEEYRRRLLDRHGIVFNELYCLSNSPVGRYLEFLLRSANYEDYMTELINAFNWSALEGVMCRTTLSVAWDGGLYDCDFNQMLALPVNHGAPAHINIFDFEKLRRRQIVTANHCYACTAGQGSSCQGTPPQRSEDSMARVVKGLQ